MSRFLAKLKVVGTVFVRFSNSPIMGLGLSAGAHRRHNPQRNCTWNQRDASDRSLGAPRGSCAYLDARMLLARLLGGRGQMSSGPERNPGRHRHSEFDPAPYNVRAPAFFIVTGHCHCWKCGDQVTVVALGVTPPFARRDVAPEWLEGTSLAVLSYVERLPTSIMNHLARFVPGFFRDESQWHRRPYWMNHCQHCDAKIGDYETIDSHSAPFGAQRFNASKLSFTVISEPFVAVAVVVKQDASQHLPS